MVATRRPHAVSLRISAALVGLGAAVFWTWAVDRVARAGGLGTGAAQALLALVGVASLGGGLGGDLVHRIGLRAGGVGCGALLAVALTILALAPGSVGPAIAAAVLFGAAYNVLVTLQCLWSTRVFADAPARGLGVVMTAMGVGFLVGPLLAAPVEQRTAFLAAAVLLAAGGLLTLVAPTGPAPHTRRSAP